MTLLRTWTIPLCLAVLIATSLFVALAGDGVWDMLACSVLAGCLAYAAIKGVAT